MSGAAGSIVRRDSTPRAPIIGDAVPVTKLCPYCRVRPRFYFTRARFDPRCRECQRMRERRRGRGAA